MARTSSRWRGPLVACALVVMAFVVPWAVGRMVAPDTAIITVADPAIRPPTRPAEPGSVRVVTWNIHHGIGRGDDHTPAAATRERLVALGHTIGAMNPDVVVLNEVEFESPRSAGRDQAAIVAAAAKLPYRVEQVNVDLQLLFVRIRHGNAILSRYPLRDARLLELPADRGWASAIAGHRQGVSAIVEHPDGEFQVVAVHMDHRDREVRVESCERVLTRLREVMPMPTVVAGDVNSGWPLTSNDDDESDKDDLVDALSVLRASPRLHGPLDRGAGTDALEFEPRDPDDLVDWILAPPEWKYDVFLVGEDDLSDHPSVLAVLHRRPAP